LFLCSNRFVYQSLTDSPCFCDHTKTRPHSGLSFGKAWSGNRRTNRIVAILLLIVAILGLVVYLFVIPSNFRVQLTTDPNTCWDAIITVNAATTTSPSGCGSTSWSFSGRTVTVSIAPKALSPAGVMDLLLLKDGNQCASDMGTVVGGSCDRVFGGST